MSHHSTVKVQHSMIALGRSALHLMMQAMYPVAGDAAVAGGVLDPQLSVHDVEAETFSSQILGQTLEALQEAMHSMTEGSNTLMR